MADTYRNFAELRATEREGIDFRICCSRRKSPAAIVAPHGGKIEPGTSEIASAIAGATHSLYCFEGLKPRGNSILHITSTNFDEPECVDLVTASDYVLSVHGLAPMNEAIDVGGRDGKLRDAICGNLVDAGFLAKIVTTGDHAGMESSNICNQGRGDAGGVQLEIARGLRDSLKARPERMAEFAHAIREAILGEIGE